jgi:hypothetical protein
MLEEAFLGPGPRQHQVDGDARGPVDHRKHARLGHERQRVADARHDVSSFEGRQEVLDWMRPGVEGDVDIGGQARGAVEDSGLGAEEVPADPEGLERRADRGEQLTDRGGGRGHEPLGRGSP